jgi:hypothetical protein
MVINRLYTGNVKTHKYITSQFQKGNTDSKLKASMEKRRKVFNFIVKANASNIMSGLLKYPEQTGKEMDGNICRLTLLRSKEDELRSQYQEKYREDGLWQIEVMGIYNREFLILESLLDSLDENVIVKDKTDLLN